MAQQPQTSSQDGLELFDIKDKGTTGHREGQVLPVSETAVEYQLSEDEKRKLLRKIDWHIMPLLCVSYGLQFLDKTALSYASIMGIRQARNISLGEYSWLGSAFYLGYLVGDFPISYLLSRFPIAKLTAATVTIWGGVLCCMAVAPDFKTLFVVRFFLGALEAGITPAFTIITSQWYLRSEQGTRTGIWASFNSMGLTLGALLAYGLAKADLSGTLSIPGWQIIFILLGCATVAMVLVLAFFLPDTPLNARFLTTSEREMALGRISVHQQGSASNQYKIYQVKEAFLDPMTWLYTTYAIAANIPNGAFTNFFSILIQSFGYTSTEALLYNTPSGAVTFVFIIGCLYLGDRYKHRIAFAIASLFVAATGVLLIWFLPLHNKTGRLIAYYFTNAYIVGFAVILSLIASNVGGRTKKATVSAITLVAYCVGNLIGPQTFRSKDAPRYNPALGTAFGSLALGIITLGLIWRRNVTENKRRLAKMSSYTQGTISEQLQCDLTDRENETFLYVS